MTSERGTLLRFFELLDAPDGDPLDVVADDLSFAIVLGDRVVRGGRAELVAFIDAREPAGRFHRLLASARSNSIEFLAGEFCDGETVFATFVAAANADAAGRMTRYLVTTSPAVRFTG